MSQDIKISVIGGGSTYTPELVEGFIGKKDELSVRELVLMDVDQHRLKVVGGLVARMLRAGGLTTKLTWTTDLPEAIEGAQYVITQIRVGGIAMRILDEKIPLEFGVIGQETTGPGGLACALRNVPALLKIAHEVERRAPEAFLINFTNPSGLATEALLRYTNVKVIGLCNVPINMQRKFAEQLGVAPEQLAVDYVGLNHLSWVRGAKVSGQDVFDQLLQHAIKEAKKGGSPFPPQLLETLAMIPSYYLRYYYLCSEVVAEQKQAGKTRAEVVQEIENELLKLYANPSLCTKPDLLAQRGGALYSTAAVGLISAIHHNKKEVHIVNVLNRGAIPDLPPESVVEVPAQIDREGAHPLPTGPLPLVIRGLVHAVKAYEQLAIQAAVEGDERAALQALVAHPLVPSFSVAQGLWKAIRQANQAFLARGER